MLLIPTRNAEAARSILQSFDDLADTGAVELRGAVIVERHADGRWRVPEETENVSHRGALTAGAIGAVIGLLAGPAGLLLGGAAGLLVGSSVEIGDAEDVETTIHALPHLIPPGTTAVIADVFEADQTVIDRALAALGVSAHRMSRAEAEAQAEAVSKATQEEAGGRR